MFGYPVLAAWVPMKKCRSVQYERAIMQAGLSRGIGFSND